MTCQPRFRKLLDILPVLIFALLVFGSFALCAGSIDADVRNVETLYRAGKYAEARDAGLALLNNRLDEMPQKKAALCTHFVNKACGSMTPDDVDSALLALEKFMSLKSLTIDQTASDVVSAAIWRYLNAKRYEEGVSAADRMLALEWTYPQGRVKVLVAKAMCLDRLKRYGDAANAFVQVTEEAKDGYKLNYANTCCAVRCLVLQAQADNGWEKAADGWVKLVVGWDGVNPDHAAGKETDLSKALHRDIVPNLGATEAVAGLVAKASEAVPRCLATPLRCYELQKAAAAFAACSGDKDLTGGMLRTLYETCPAEFFQDTVDFVANTFKRTDGSLVRANRFLDYVKFGTVGQDGKAGTDDDGISPFPAGPATMSPEVASAYQEALGAEWKETWQDKRALATLYRYMGEPQSALKLLSEAFALAPMEPGPLQAVAGDMTNVLIQLSGNPADGERLNLFLKFGKDGQDGKAGTEDDLADPRLPFLQAAK